MLTIYEMFNISETRKSLQKHRIAAYSMEVLGQLSMITGVSRLVTYRPEPITLADQIFFPITNLMFTAFGIGFIVAARMCQNYLTRDLNDLSYQARQTDKTTTVGNSLEQTVQTSTEKQ